MHEILLPIISILVAAFGIAIGWWLSRNPARPRLLATQLAQSTIVPVADLPGLDVTLGGVKLDRLTSFTIRVANIGSAEVVSAHDDDDPLLPQVRFTMSDASARIMRNTLTPKSTVDEPVVRPVESGSSITYLIRSLKRRQAFDIELLVAHEQEISCAVTFAGAGFDGRVGESDAPSKAFQMGHAIASIVLGTTVLITLIAYLIETILSLGKS